MKKASLVMLAIICYTQSYGQVLKNLGRGIKSDIEVRIRGKVIQQVDKAIDSALLKQRKNKREESEQPTNTRAKEQDSPDKSRKHTSNSSSINNPKKAEDNADDLKVTDGYVQLTLSAYEVFIGGTVIIQGYSLKWGNLKEVEITIKGPETNERRTSPLYDNNTFAEGFQPERSGEFIKGDWL
jgi:DNA mismatch repair ATPase MutL